jgi:1-acyl-sn-glycerol-3-phosphate acyltransferase
VSFGWIKAKIAAADRWLGPRLFRIPVRFWYGTVVFVVRSTLRLLFGAQVYGRERVPREGKLLIVANHMSNLDPPLIGSMFPREMHYAAKIQLFKGPLGKLIAYANGLAIRRTGSDKDAIKRLVGALKGGNALIMFPEGTRQGEGGGATKAGPGMVAALAKADILPARIIGTHDPKKALFRVGGIKLIFGDPIPHQEMVDEARSRLPEGTSKKELYHMYSDIMMEHVRAL